MGGSSSSMVKKNEFFECELVISKVKKELPWPARIERVDEQVELDQRRYIVRRFVTGEKLFLGKKHVFPYKQNRKIKDNYKKWFTYIKAWEKIEEELVSRYPECCYYD